MASDESIAIRKAIAQTRIDFAAGKLAKALGFSVKEAALAPRHKDPAIQVAVHLEAIALFLEAAADKAAKAQPRPPGDALVTPEEAAAAVAKVASGSLLKKEEEEA
jgi:hypothetical protein